MSDTVRQPPRNLLARGLKLLGELTHPDTRTGKAFTRAEQGLTRVAERLASSPTYLRFSGGALRQGTGVRIRRRALVERALNTLRMPTSSEVDDLRVQLRRMEDQVEALGSQLEHAVELLERPQSPPARAPASRRRRG